ncbi:hypothetical protein H2198_001579 [Neophaeococcomyces mojaviensis]|uniref:Uncharacterized protein n=1 Tax=Neophaeococcomyces mojaviensis TaxID=3383035 RepID=A0ACC3AH47_9EURO|nr:hypothetical protein H2198_001579 [Knufia sp. JES_112]
MPTTKDVQIPSFYRFYFRWLDPAVCLWAVYMDFFTPDVVYNAFVPTTLAPRNPQHDFLLEQIGGALLMLAVLDIFMLRLTNDIKVWKTLQAAVFLYDWVCLYSIYSALRRQDRLRWDAFRLLEDGGSIGITVQAALVRAAFLLDVGLGRAKSAGEKRA